MNSYVDLGIEQFLSWEHRKECPKTINFPSEYEGQSDLRIACTQLNLSASKQKKLVNEWAALIPTLTHVEHIWFYSRVPQRLLDSVSRLPKLRSLFIKWSGNGITDLVKVGDLKSLERLYIGSCTQLETLESLKKLKNLKWLELHELKKINDISAIKNVNNLVGLTFTGGMFGKQYLKSIEAISHLTNLEFLDLHRLKVESEDVSAISKLKKLKYLDLPIYYPLSEFARIYAALPNCDHDIYAFRKTNEICVKCMKGEMVLPMAKNKRQICTVCSELKVKKLEDEFLGLVASYS
ncbi:leucine-rich repeat domain-containing protein [Paraglaciecola marina]|uniref:leucine-rich repeat domain-containing protein n=1 Tax=Paraglaciecola marina TaxID=2500157 RepID=UPI0010600DCC|nr:leucine-rich repeat domain-containing protein [Paraglaciecola marina]